MEHDLQRRREFSSRASGRRSSGLRNNRGCRRNCDNWAGRSNRGRRSDRSRAARGWVAGGGRRTAARAAARATAIAIARVGDDGAAVARRGRRLAGLGGDIRARVGKHDVGTLESAAAVVDVGLEDLRTAAERRGSAALAAAAAADGDNGTVHVAVEGSAMLGITQGGRHIQLSVADVVEPGPGKDGVGGRRGIGGQSELEARGAGDGTVADVAVDDGEGVSLVEGKSRLATAAVVVGTAVDGHVVLLAGLPSGDGRRVLGSEEIQGALAGEVAARGGHGTGDAVVDVGGEGVQLGPKRRRVGHGHVSRGLASQQRDHGDEGDGLHDVWSCRVQEMSFEMWELR